MSSNEMSVAQNQTQVSPVQAKGGGMNVFADVGAFETALRMAKCLSSSTVVPKDYQNNAGNCMIAIEMAARIGTSPMMVMQNLYIVNGRPGWSSQWIIAMINASRRFKTELQFSFGNDPKDGGLSCQAWAEDWMGHKVFGPKITMKMANEEGWTTKNGSKWKTMPEVMIQYRAASFFGRMNCPDMIMGIYSQDEILDMDLPESSFSDIKIPEADPATGEVIDETTPVTQDQRQELFTLLKAHYTSEQRNAVLKELLDAEGCESTTELTVAAHKRIMAKLQEKIKETAEGDSSPEEETPEGSPEDAD